MVVEAYPGCTLDAEHEVHCRAAVHGSWHRLPLFYAGVIGNRSAAPEVQVQRRLFWKDPVLGARVWIRGSHTAAPHGQGLFITRGECILQRRRRCDEQGEIEVNCPITPRYLAFLVAWARASPALSFLRPLSSALGQFCCVVFRGSCPSPRVLKVQANEMRGMRSCVLS